MSKPGYYSDIGKKAKDVLNRDFAYDHTFQLNTFATNGVNFTNHFTKKGDNILAHFKSEYKYSNVKTELKVDSTSKVHATFHLEEVAPGLKVVLTGFLPDQKSQKVEAYYANANAGLTAVMGLNAKPHVDVSAAVGSDGVVLGGEVGFNTATNSVTRYNVALGFLHKEFHVAVAVQDQFDTVKGTYVQYVNPTTTVAVELVHKLSAKNDNVFTAACACRLDPLTTAKVRFNNRGILSGLIQHEWRPKSTITVAGEMDIKAMDKAPKVGLAIALKP